jgi:lipid-A-disaccharide synthase
MTDQPVFFLIAGEPSGDLLGARLMQALRQLTQGKARFVGIGGERMQAEGIELFFPQSELAHFGLFELLRHVPHLLQRIKETVAEIKRIQPAALITIDAPDFSFRVAKQLKGQGVPLIHYVAPTVWAWRPGRAKKVAQFLDHLLALLPFEPPYFTRERLPCTFVGHPIVESGADHGNAAAFRQRHGLDDTTPLLTILPGSRQSEITRLLPIFGATLAQLRNKHPYLRVVVPTLAPVAAQVKAAAAGWALPTLIVEGDQEKYDAFATSTAALACSGTVSVELAMARLPTIITYKVSALTAALYRHFIKAKYATLINIMQDRIIMPEYLQDDCTPEKLAAAVDELLTRPGARQRQVTELTTIAAWLGRGQFVPSERAAQVILDVVRYYPKSAMAA